VQDKAPSTAGFGLRLVAIFVLALVVTGALYILNADRVQERGAAEAQAGARPPGAGMDVRRVRIVSEIGALTVEFYPEYAPAVVADLTRLIGENYYDTDTFIESRPGLGFVLVKAGDTMRHFDFTDAQSTVKSKRGVVAISRRNVSDAYVNNLFFGYSARPDLEPYYLIIGNVVEGLEKIERAPGNRRYRIKEVSLLDESRAG